MSEPSFRFVEKRWYRFSCLRAAKNEICQACRDDPEFGKRLRNPSGPDHNWLKSWKEEHLPLTELANGKGLPDDARFIWTPDQPADFNVKVNGEAFGIQCTMAYPKWPNPTGKSAGHTRALERIQYDSGLPSYGGGQVSRPTARSPQVDLKAWQDGIKSALSAKLDPKYAGLRLLIFAERARFDLIDFEFAKAVAPAVEAKAEAWHRIFQAIYVVDVKALAHFARD